MLQVEVTHILLDGDVPQSAELLLAACLTYRRLFVFTFQVAYHCFFRYSIEKSNKNRFCRAARMMKANKDLK